MADEAKRRAGEAAVDLFVRDSMVLGLGTGSTAAYAIGRLGALLREGRLKDIAGVPTSEQTAELARAEGIRVLSFADVAELDLAIDGADEVSPALDLIKGGGGALLREKLVASAAERFVVVADASKQVPVLGAFPLPVEVVPFGWELTARRVGALGCKPRLRLAEGGRPFVTDNGNFVLDCPFGAIGDPGALHRELKALVGVVETGLFTGMATAAVIGTATGYKVRT